MDDPPSPAAAVPRQNEFLPDGSELRERDERLVSLKALVSQLGHDFKNLLVPQFGYVTLIKEEAGENPAIATFAEKLESSARRTEGFLDSVLMAVRPQRRFIPKTTDFTALIEQAVKTWSAELPSSAAIKVRAELTPCTMAVDERHWLALLPQLFNNARFALPGGGTLTVSLAPRTLTPEQTAALSLVDSSVFELVVRDDGFGMQETVLKRALEPFFTTRAKNQAAGLGLTMVQSVVQLHGGQVLLRSTPDVGTTVTIWLPAQGGPPPHCKPAYGKRSAEESPSGKTTQLLLVERDPLVCEALKAYLQRNLPCTVLVAHDGGEGLKLLQKPELNLRLVVSETFPPQVSGFELYEKSRSLKPEIRTILIGLEADANAERALRNFGSSAPLLIKKPFAPRTLVEAIRLHLA